MNGWIKSPATVLFIGDSVTDCGRNREVSEDLGSGYVKYAADWYAAKYPEARITFYNRGISGDRLETLTERWETDCLRLKPDWITLLIGVNHTVHRFKRDLPTSTEQFEHLYRNLLEQTVQASAARLILMSPFVLPVEHSETPSYVPMKDRWAEWRADLDPKIAVVQRLAEEFQAEFVPLDERFTRAAEARDPQFWLPDGVHPSGAGHALIAQAWLETVQAI